VNAEYASAILDCQAQRLAVSSNSTIKTAVSHWEPFATEHGLSLLVENGDPARGGIMASFAVHLARKKLAYGTIQGYIWGLEQHHINNGHHSPLDSVQDWSRWMRSLEVQIYTPSEETEMVPFLLLTRSLLQVNRSDFVEVRTACAILMLFFTMSRSEYPVPKTHQGKHDFDPDQHCRMRDVRTCNGYVEWAFGKIKQDQLKKRVRGGKREWKPVGNATGIMSMAFWLDLYLQLKPSNPDPESPFFVRADGKPLLYHDLLGDMRNLFCKVPGITLAIAKRLGLHGLRVLGYNAGRAAMGEDVAALQGGWFSDCHQTYGRETLNKVLDMAGLMSKMAAEKALPSLPLMPEAPIFSPDGHVFSDTSAFTPPVATPSVESSSRTAEGYSRDVLKITSEPRGSSSRRYHVYFMEGTQYRSLKAAKRAQESSFDKYLASFGYVRVPQLVSGADGDEV
jgi:hypothetical protein